MCGQLRALSVGLQEKIGKVLRVRFVRDKLTELNREDSAYQCSIYFQN